MVINCADISYSSFLFVIFRLPGIKSLAWSQSERDFVADIFGISLANGFSIVPIFCSQKYTRKEIETSQRSSVSEICSGESGVIIELTSIDQPMFTGDRSFISPHILYTGWPDAEREGNWTRV